jgi:hypothetical protein
VRLLDPKTTVQVVSGTPQPVVTEAYTTTQQAEKVPALKGWELTVDNTSEDGLVYYTDLATGVTQWEMPAELDAMHFLENVTELNVSHNRLSALAPVCA